MVGTSSTEASQDHLSWGHPGTHYLSHGEGSPSRTQQVPNPGCPLLSSLGPALPDPLLSPDSASSPSFCDFR